MGTVNPTILLDIDGVLLPQNTAGHAAVVELFRIAGYDDAVPLPEFDSGCMAALASCVRGTGSELVLSSAWRETAEGRRAVDRQLARHGLPRCAGCTPQLPRRGRAAEILAWAEEAARSGACWVALDDEPLQAALPEHHFVQCDASVGLTEADAERVIECLRKQQHARLGMAALLGMAELPRRRRAGATRSMLGRMSLLRNVVPTGEVSDEGVDTT
jgi:hypothetical protein